MLAVSKRSYLEDLTFLTPEFVRKAMVELERSGFVSDEHDFAPYRETMTENMALIEKALLDGGYRGGPIRAGFVDDHPQAGYAYFIYDEHRFPDRAAADAAVRRWLDARYGQ